MAMAGEAFDGGSIMLRKTNIGAYGSEEQFLADSNQLFNQAREDRLQIDLEKLKQVFADHWDGKPIPDFTPKKVKQERRAAEGDKGSGGQKSKSKKAKLNKEPAPLELEDWVKPKAAPGTVVIAPAAPPAATAAAPAAAVASQPPARSQPELPSSLLYSTPSSVSQTFLDQYREAQATKESRHRSAPTAVYQRFLHHCASATVIPLVFSRDSAVQSGLRLIHSMERSAELADIVEKQRDQARNQWKSDQEKVKMKEKQERNRVKEEKMEDEKHPIKFQSMQRPAPAAPTAGKQPIQFKIKQPQMAKNLFAGAQNVERKSGESDPRELIDWSSRVSKSPADADAAVQKSLRPSGSFSLAVPLALSASPSVYLASGFVSDGRSFFVRVSHSLLPAAENRFPYHLERFSISIAVDRSANKPEFDEEPVYSQFDSVALKLRVGIDARHHDIAVPPASLALAAAVQQRASEVAAKFETQKKTQPKPAEEEKAGHSRAESALMSIGSSDELESLARSLMKSGESGSPSLAPLSSADLDIIRQWPIAPISAQHRTALSVGLPLDRLQWHEAGFFHALDVSHSPPSLVFHCVTPLATAKFSINGVDYESPALAPEFSLRSLVPHSAIEHAQNSLAAFHSSQSDRWAQIRQFHRVKDKLVRESIAAAVIDQPTSPPSSALTRKADDDISGDSNGQRAKRARIE